MNEKEALQIIENMISKTKTEIGDNGFMFLFWGWLVFIAATTNLYLLVYTDFEFHSIPWAILMPFGGIVSAIYGRRKRKRAIVRTYIDETITHVVWGFGISLLVICLFMPMGEQFKAFYPTIMIIYSIWLYFSGGILKFKPLVWGAFLNWALAATGYVWADTRIHLILMAVAVLGGYIIPGYMLKRKYDQNVQGT